MSRSSLEQKIALMLQDIEKLNEADRLTVVTEFILSELNLMEKSQNWNARDLSQIKSIAIEIAQKLSTESRLEGKQILSSGPLLEKFCMVAATLNYLRGKDMLPYAVKIEDFKEVCEHPQASIGAITRENPRDIKFQCNSCGSEVKPVGWASKSK